MAKVIVVSNEKGGVAKTTTAEVFAAELHRRKYRVLAIDLDPQGDLSSCSKAKVDDEVYTSLELLTNKAPVQNIIQQLPRFDIIPSDKTLSTAPSKMPAIGKEYSLKKAIAPILNDYDYIIIDTPPSLDALTINAFTCANEVIIPSMAGIFSVKGVSNLNTVLQEVREYYNPIVHIDGILITMYSPNINVRKSLKEVTEKIAEVIHTRVYDTYIRSTSVVEVCQANQQDLIDSCGDCTAACDYKRFVSEYLNLHREEKSSETEAERTVS
jgi:chromosome partitioning protein